MLRPALLPVAPELVEHWPWAVGGLGIDYEWMGQQRGVAREDFSAEPQMTRRSQTWENLERRLRRARGGGIGRCGRREEGRERLDVSLEARRQGLEGRF